MIRPTRRPGDSGAAVEQEDVTTMRAKRWRARAAILCLSLGMACVGLASTAQAAEWIPGHYEPHGHWIPGHWVGGGPHRERPPEDLGPPPGWREGRVWIPGHYNGPNWDPGHWADR
jgi:hypothetical protein